MARAKVFWSGRSQAVRLPKEFRFSGDEVRIRRQGNRVILEPIGEDWSWLEQSRQAVDPDFVEGALEKQDEQQRPALDDLFF